MTNSCRSDGIVDFTVTEDHVTLLKNLNIKTATFISDRLESGSYFQNCPAIDGKRPFGNSGDPAWEALHTLHVEPAGPDGDYSPDQLTYGRYLILSLPLAYEAVMDHGVIEPCTGRVSIYGGAGFSFRNKRVLEYWRDAVNEACALDCVSSDQLITLLINTGRVKTPLDPVFDIASMMEHCYWTDETVEIFSRHAVRKYKTAHPEARDLDHDTVMSRLKSGEYVLGWDSPDMAWGG